MPTLFCDLETGPAAWTLEQGLAEAVASVPSNYKDPAKIDAHIREHASGPWLRTPLDPHQGRIVCIGWAVDAGPILVLSGTDEVGMLREFGRVVCSLPSDTLWCGHGLKGFDLPYLMRKAILHGLWDLTRRIPWPRLDDKWNWEKRTLDTKDAWRGPAFGQAPSLDEIATFLGLKTKADSGMTGADVWRYVGEERWLEIGAYCTDDVERVRDIALRLWQAGIVRASWGWAEEYLAGPAIGDEDIGDLFDWPHGEGPRRGA